MSSPKFVWIIMDPLDGPHIFRGEKDAKRTFEKWRRQAKKNGDWDSFWEMSEPAKYVRC